MAKFAKILGLLGLGSDKEAVTEAHLQAAEDKVLQLEQAKADADAQVAEAQAALKTAQQAQAKTDAALKTAEEKTATLEEWKKNQAVVDEREEDESNKLDTGKEALASWEIAAASAVATAKKRVGDK